MKRNAEPDEILERLGRIRISQRQFEIKADLPRNFITNAKTGKFRSPESEKWWDKALIALEELEAKSQRGGPKPAANPHGIAPPELLIAIQKLQTEDDALSLQRMLIEYAARGLVSNAFLKISNDALSRFQQLVRQKREAQDAQHAGDVVRVEIYNVSDWRQPGPCPYCQGHGQLP